MKADDRALADLAASVADGDPVDWGAVASKPGAPAERLVRHLRLVENIASLYRSIPAEDDLEPASLGVAPVAEPDGPRWGRLVIRESIGRGTSADVYRAWDRELHREVALKLLRETMGPEAEEHTRQRMLQEARRLARVRHPHVVQVYGAEEHDGRVGLWMELARGESLEQIVAARGTFGAAEATTVARDLCAALAAVHGAGLLHRDVKAQNVLRESGGRIVLMDFGTGEELREGGGSAKLAGTPLYLAPEIFRGEAASIQSDLYSLGVLLFYLVTGQFPVTASSIAQLARAHTERRAKRLRDVRPDLPAAFVAAVERSLSHDPADRYRTAGEMEAALAGSGDRFQRPVVVTSTRPWSLGTRPFAWSAIALILAAAAVAAIVWSMKGPRGPASVAGSITSIAVLPLADVSGPGQSPYLADALTDELIGTLGQIGSLRVASRTSVMPFKDAKPSLQQVFDALGVDALVEGTVAAVKGEGGSPGRVRVNARLIAAGTGAQLWSDSLERPAGDTLALQAHFARQIARAVRASITRDESRRLDQTRSTSAPAEEAYFQGRYHLGQYGLDRARRALDAFTRASQLDPDHAAARAGAARAYFNLGFGGAMSQAEARALALAEVRRALDTDEHQVDAHVALGDLKFYYDWDWEGAGASYRRAIELNPSFAYARTQHARFLAASKRLDAAAAEAAAAAELDPLSADAAQTLGLMLYFKRDYRAAEQALERALTLDPGYARARAVLGRVYDAEGRAEDALEQTRQAVAMSSDPGVSWQVQLIRLEALAGRRDEARARFATLSRDVERRKLQIAAEHLAYLHLALGDVDLAFAHLDRAVRERDPGVLWLAVDPRVDPMRADARFQPIVSRLGIPTGQ